MSLTTDDVTRIAQLSKLQFDEAHTATIQNQLNRFFDEVVGAMQAAPTDGVEPLTDPLDMVQEVQLRLAEDVASESDQREANQQSAPAVEKGLFLVPKVVE